MARSTSYPDSPHDAFGINKRVPSTLPDALPNPGMPRANGVASREKPDVPDNMTPYAGPGALTPLQKVRL
jgi:hypothetical protein